MAAPNSNSVFCGTEPCPARYRISARAPSDPRKPSKADLLMTSLASVASPPTELARRSDADSRLAQSIAGDRESPWYGFQPADI